LIKRIKNKIKYLIKSATTKTYYVFGDSHCEVFEHISDEKLLKGVEFKVNWIGGATAQGMRNPNSKTNALSIFSEDIKNINRNADLFFQLGEVDTGFVIWYRSMKYNEPVNKQLNDSVRHYFEFLNEVSDLGFENITIISAPLPTIKDNQDWGEIANLRKEIKATQVERTELTIAYNNLLKEEAEKNGYKFIDTDIYLFNENTGIIREEFLNKDKNNHHLDLEAYTQVLLKAFNEKN
tara:strand:+ start:293 stop:1003 length:711 start_codon:yes stop_codon:yes gene_type:complete